MWLSKPRKIIKIGFIINIYNNHKPKVNSNPLTIRDIKESESKVSGKNQDKQDSNQDQKELKLFAVIIWHPQI